MDEVVDTQEMPVVAAEPQPIKFTIFETVVYGQQVFRPGQEEALLAASWPIGTLRQLIERGAIRGQYPGLEQLQKNSASFTQFKTGN